MGCTLPGTHRVSTILSALHVDCSQIRRQFIGEGDISCRAQMRRLFVLKVAQTTFSAGVLYVSAPDVEDVSPISVSSGWSGEAKWPSRSCHSCRWETLVSTHTIYSVASFWPDVARLERISDWTFGTYPDAFSSLRHSSGRLWRDIRLELGHERVSCLCTPLRTIRDHVFSSV